jgi:acyl-CoA synthetase (AMP-forming)/AMP-acid ligase II
MTQPHVLQEQPDLKTPGDMLSLLERTVQDRPFFPLFTFLNRRLQPARVISCQELMAESTRLAGVMQSRFSRGEPLILFYSHNPAFIFAFFACVMAGCVPVPLGYNKRRDAEKLCSLLASSGIRAIVSTSDILANIAALQTSCQTDDKDTPLKFMATDQCDIATSWSRPAVNAWDAALIQLSTGSSGALKGVALSHVGVLTSLLRLSGAMKLNTEDRMLSVTSCQEGHGLMMHVLLPVYAGISSFFLDMNSFLSRPSSWLEAIGRYGCTISGSLGSGYASASAKDGHGRTSSADLDLSGWRVAYVGPDVADVRALRRFAKKFSDNGFLSRSYFHFYGMAETGYFVCGRFGLNVKNINSISYISAGKIPDSYEWKIVCENGRERDAGEGILSLSSASIGVKCIPAEERNSRPFAEYLDATSAACRAGIKRTVLTGDMIFSRNGEIYIRGQLANKISTNGKTFNLQDIEALAMSGVGCRRAIRCVAVFLEERKELMLAVECSHGDVAERWHGAVVRIKESIVCAIGVAPSRILLLRPNSLPVSANGKILRAECKLLLRSDALMARLLPVRGRGLPLTRL